MRLTKQQVDKIEVPTSGQLFYRDDVLKGFALRVTESGARSFILEKRVAGKVKRITLGRYPDISVEQARKQAHKLLGKIATGINPIAERKASKQRAITLQEALTDYLKVRKSMKASTKADYQKVIKSVFPDWLDRPLLDITKDMIAKRHAQYGSTRSESAANLAMRIMRAVFNFAAGQYEDEQGKSLILENPVKRLSHTRAWYRVSRRQTIIKKHELPRWYEAVMNIEMERSTNIANSIRDFLLLLLFTGLRRSEAAKLKWDNVDFHAKTLTIHDTKNHEQHVLPLSEFLYDMLSKRKVQSESIYVFNGREPNSYIIEPRKVMDKIIERSGVQFTPHDLRRTFITIAESLDIPAYALKRLLNHKNKADVTAGYLVIDVERLRKPMEQITDMLLKLIGVKIVKPPIKLNLLEKTDEI